jgi:CRP/FNR family cyclic AMP-dependent transcriptional regulator
MTNDWPSPNLLGSVVSIPRGTSIAKPGSEVHTLYLIEEGLVGRFVPEPNDGVLDAIRSSGWLIGAVAAMTTRRYQTTVVALTDCALRPIPISVFRSSLETQRVSRWLNEMLAADMFAQTSRSVALAKRGIRPLVEALFIELIRGAGKPTKDGSVRIMLHLTVVDVAGLVGATREHTSRVLAELEAAGYLTKVKNWFVAPVGSPLIDFGMALERDLESLVTSAHRQR